MYIFIRNICFFVMKLVKINESQHKRLFEGYREGFSFEELSIIADSAFADEDNSLPQFEYCRKWLGEPVSMGSSRCIFMLSDNVVLKLAYGGRYKAGIDQNKHEYLLFNQVKSPLFVRIYDSDKNFTYLVCENVIPCEPVDFEKIIGIPFYREYHQKTYPQVDRYSYNYGHTTVGYDKYFGKNLRRFGENVKGYCLHDIMAYIEANYVLHEDCFNMEIEKMILHNKWLKEFRELIRKTEVGDFCKHDNFGIVNRDGKMNIVVLDAGMTMDVWYKHYKYG